MAGNREAYVRERMREDWGARTRHYTRYAAPQTRPFAELLVAKMALRSGERVLDVATGPGVVALAAARAVGPTGEVVATDLAPEWGDVIAEESAAAGVGNVTFRTMGAEELDLPDGSFDVALCSLGLMFVPDPVRALREMRRVLRDGGRLGIAVWSTGDKVTAAIVPRLIAAAAPPVPEAEQLPSPLALGEPGLIERHVAAAGFREITVERHTLDYVLEDAEEYWRRWVEAPSATTAAALAALSPAELERVHAAAIATLERHRRDGEIRLPSEAIYVTAVR